jgi:electron transport complex protein RnfE
LWDENPVLVLLLGLCPTLAVTTSFYNGLGMGLAASFVLLGSNIVIAIMRKSIPKIVRIPCFIVVIATFVTIVDLVLEAYQFDLHRSLGLFVPLIVVNCIILGRAEAFASKKGVFISIIDALGMGIGFTITLIILGSIREILGNGTLTLFQSGENILRFNVCGASYPGILAILLPPGAFLALGFFLALQNFLMERKEKQRIELKIKEARKIPERL